MRRSALAGWALVGALIVAACAGGQQVTPLPEQVPGDAERGRVAITDHGCMSCHAIPGIPGNHNEVGPPLAGIASRRVIAGRLPNTPENMAEWVRNPQRVDPGNVMPDLGLTRTEAQDIAAYLYTLR